MAFPTLLLYLIIIAAVGPSRINVVLAITIGGFPGVARLVRSMVLDVKNREYVAAARAARRIDALHHVSRDPAHLHGPGVHRCLPTGRLRRLCHWDTGLLGLGLPPPDPDWGKMVAEGRMWIITAPWIALVPSLAISSLVVGLNLFADGVNAASRRF